MAVVATLSKGYDLEYIWVQVDRGPVKDAASYYLQASENGGEPPGRWWGPGALALGLAPGQIVERDVYDLLFAQRKAPDGTSRLPGERALQQEFGLAPVTIRKAVRQLRDEGLVRTTPGWGTYVVKKNDDANP